ncbi:MAG: hypothetical protein ACO2O6_10130 [Candidatus Hydrothermia bacterium]
MLLASTSYDGYYDKNWYRFSNGILLDNKFELLVAFYFFIFCSSIQK